MRTAEEIAFVAFNRWAFSGNERDAMIKAINEAREEAIWEAAKLFIINEGSCGEFGMYKPPFIERQSVINLINQLK